MSYLKHRLVGLLRILSWSYFWLLWILIFQNLEII